MLEVLKRVRTFGRKYKQRIGNRKNIKVGIENFNNRNDQFNL